ncbi:MAG: DNA-3-methyladenine glycosylase [Geodermatophilaceae bacterium]|nr:DNA-3-methyladenine glycosylase [Geodermatophilaceae bacterium]
MVDLAELLSRRALDVAPQLLGVVFAHRSPEGVVAVRITEVEAYSGDGSDPAAHTHRGPTPRNKVMFGPPGTLYVYFSYGMHWCANVVCSPHGSGEAVLLRAGEVVDGVEVARRRRPAARRDVDLARGPARLTQALGITGADSGRNLLDPRSTMYLSPRAPVLEKSQVRTGPRVGISKAVDLPWRFWLDVEPTVSGLRKPRV